MGFEPAEQAEGKILPIQWKGTIARTLNGTIVRMHEIANVGKPILDSNERRAHEPSHHLRHVLQHAAKIGKDGKRRSAHREQSHLLVLHGVTDETICVVKYSG
jgi:hypothetical protein